MGENNASASITEDIVTELESLNINGLDTDWLTKTENLKKNRLSQSGVSKKELEIDTKLSELQCPFTWPLPRTDIVPSAFVSKLTEKVKEIEDVDEFEMRKFVCNIVIVYELCNDGKLEEANKKLTSVLSYLEDLYKNCKEDFFGDMKRPLQHIMLSYKAHLLKAYSVHLLPAYADLYYSRMEKILSEVYPYSEMTEVEQAGIYGFRAQVFSEYGYSGSVEALEYAKKAIGLDPKQAEWHFLTGKIMGRIRRCANWNDCVKIEEIKLLEDAVELHEKPSFMVFLACAYIECTRSIYRNIDVDKDIKKKLNEMNNRAKKLFMRCLELNPACSHVYIRCASGMIKMPKPFVDKDVVETCIARALQKAPNNGMAHHVAGMFAERHRYDIEKALHHYEISSDLCVYGATADLIRLKYTFEKDYDLLSALEKMLDNAEALPNRHTTLSCIGSYYLFLKRDLIRALSYYGRVMDEDHESSALKAHKPVFLNMRTPLNMYEILHTEVNLELKKDELGKEEVNVLNEFLKKLNKIDPEISEKFADKRSRIQQIVDEAVVLTDKYKTLIRKQQHLMNRKEGGTQQSSSGGNLKSTVNRGRGRGRGGPQNVRRHSNSVGSWRNRDNDTEEKELVEVKAESGDSGSSYQPKKNDSFNSYTKIFGRPRTTTNGGNENEDPVRHKEHDTENKTVQKFQKSRPVQTVRDPYGPNEGGVQKSFERKRVPDKKWIPDNP